MRRRVLLLGAILALCLVGGSIGAARAHALDGAERGLIEAINQLRIERGIAALRHEPRLARIAGDFAGASARGAPRSDRALDVSARLRDHAYAFLSMRAFADLGVADPVVQARVWAEDPERRDPLLDPAYQEVGIGRVDLSERFAGAAGEPRVNGGRTQVWGIVLAAPTSPVPAGWGERVLENVNIFRQRYGLLPLSRNRLLDRAAQAHVEDMARRDYFAHRTPDGTGPADRVDRVGYHWSRVLENLAAGQPSAREVVQGWIDSKAGHREAMLDKTVREVGIGYTYRPQGGSRVPVQHFWAMTMAAPR
ncbi:hypothetical protein KAJ83_12830 [Marivibrio halodurans]|uniref:SCP domain-containing protein n=1 Tax=Marivibrio halodurans TaxID=2039722 RepID=A0A8J7V1L0_9PROT|nr:hypothetical protein [Marivibrio halodurans]